MQYLADGSFIDDEWQEEEQAQRWRLPLWPSRPIGWVLSVVVTATAILCAVVASASIERWFTVRHIFKGDLKANDLIASEARWLEFSGALAIASGVSLVLFTIWSMLANANAHRLAAVPASVTPQPVRILIGGGVLAAALAAGTWITNMDYAHLVSVGLALLGLLIIPSPFTRLARVAQQSTVVARPFRKWRSVASLAYACLVGSHLLIRQRFGLHDLSDELSAESLFYTALERAPKSTVAPLTDIAQVAVTSTTAPLLDAAGSLPALESAANPMIDAAATVPTTDPIIALAPLGRITSQTIEYRLLGDALLMTTATLAIAVMAASIAVGVCGLDRRHRVFSLGGMTVREAKSLV